MSLEQIFIALWLLAVISMVIILYKRGKKALAIFPPMVDPEQISFYEKSVSGYSEKSMRTKFGGASKTMEVLVTNDELWLKSSLLAASIAQKADLLHRVKADQLLEVEKKKRLLHLTILDDEGEEHKINLRLKNPESFISAIATLKKPYNQKKLLK